LKVKGERRYRVHFEIPVLSWFLEVDDDLFIRELEFLERDVSSMCVWTAVVCVESDLGVSPVLSLIAAAHCMSGLVGGFVVEYVMKYQREQTAP